MASSKKTAASKGTSTAAKVAEQAKEVNQSAEQAKQQAPVRKKGALGKGLGALLGDMGDGGSGYSNYAEPGSEAEEAVKVGALPGAVAEIPLSAIEVNPYNPRNHFDDDALEELANSIRAQGIIQPLTVRRMGEGQYQLIAGERRYRASKLVGLEAVPAYVRAANDEQMLEMALIENVQRENLNPIEVALAYKRLMDECNLVLEEVGTKVGKKRPTINNYLRLLKLPPEVQKALRDQLLTMGHARALINIENPVTQLELFREVLGKGLSVRETEERVRKIGLFKEDKPEKEDRPSSYKLQLREVERSLGKQLNTRVAISSKGEGKGGEIRLTYYNDEDLNRLLDELQNA